MEFKKIDETMFQCLLNETDLEDNNISIDDFFRNDTEKIHGLLDVVMREAQKSIGVELQGGVMSLQLAPQPNHTLLMTVSSGNNDLSQILKKVGKAMPDFGNIIKKDDSDSRCKAAPFKSIDDISSEPGMIGECEFEDNVIFMFEDYDSLEQFCGQSRKTWGINNCLYKDKKYSKYYLYMERKRCSKNKFEQFCNDLYEYALFTDCSDVRLAYMEEHMEKIIAENAINVIKKISC